MASTKVTIIPPLYKRILSRFPQSFTFCFAYGSAVKKQLENKSSENMIDLVFCVNNPITWHEANLKYNSSHYSGLKYFGNKVITQYQRNFGAKVYFNTLVPLDGILIKYGVVATEDLVTDLLEWSHLYLAGRLHKPVEFIIKPLSTELDTALQLNLQSAVHAALLILPDSFTEYEFYHTISNLSYSGDFRMTFGENKKKVENIVRAQLPSFRNLYRPFILSLSDYVDFPMFKEEKETEAADENFVITKVYNPNEPAIYCAQDISPIARLHHLNQLPRWPQKALTRFWNRGTLRQDTEDVLRAIAYDPDCGEIVKQCINEIVWKSSVGQSLKSIVTAGLFKSVKYSSHSASMYQLSDSDSIDSDEGIRYKTDSIRNKQNSIDSVRNEGNSDRNHRRKSRSPHRHNHRERKKVKKHKREHSPEERKSRSKKTHREREKRGRSEEKCVNFKNVKYSQKNEKDKSERFGPVLPPKIIKSDPKKEEILVTGPTLPPRLIISSENIESKKKESNKVIGPVLPPHLVVSSEDEREIAEGLVLPPHFVTVSSLEEEESAEETNVESSENTSQESKSIIGPALPPHLKKNTADEPESPNKSVGPVLPPHLREKLENYSDEIVEEDEVYGPIPEGGNYSRAHVELEERALKIKMDQLDPSEDKQPAREEWMLTLPEVKAANLGLGPRQFRAKGGPDMSDRSSWTDTPEDKAKKKVGKSEAKVDLKKEGELLEIQKRNKEQEAIAKKNRKHKESLLDIHRKKLKEDKKNDSGPSERRPFSREIDLQVNRFDEAQKKAVLKKAQQLDNRFSTGESKFL